MGNIASADHHPEEHSDFAGSKKPYQPPELLEWGSIVDVTRGPGQEAQDFPMGGGTAPT